jgi:hypothetical protein
MLLINGILYNNIKKDDDLLHINGNTNNLLSKITPLTYLSASDGRENIIKLPIYKLKSIKDNILRISIEQEEDIGCFLLVGINEDPATGFRVQVSGLTTKAIAKNT